MRSRLGIDPEYARRVLPRAGAAVLAVAILYAAAMVIGVGADSAGRSALGLVALIVSILLGFTIRHQVARERDQAAQLARQNTFLDALFEQAGSLVAVLELDGRLARVNPAGAELSGFAAEELIGRPFWEVLMEPEAAAGVASYWEGCAVADLAPVVEVPMVTRDGQCRRIHWTVAPLRDDCGTIVNLIATGLDVTLEREAQAALADSEYRFRTLISNLPGTMLGLYDRDLRCIALDGPLIADQELDRSRLEGKLLAEVLPPENMAILRPPLEAALRGESTTFEYMSFLTESFHEIEVVPFRRDGEIRGAFMVSRDISRRRRAEAEVRAAEDRFADSFEHAPVGMEMIDLEGRFIGVNPALAAIVGRDREQLLRAPHQRDHRHRRRRSGRAAAGRDPRRGVRPLRRREADDPR